ILFSSTTRPPPTSSLFPYTTLFRSADPLVGLSATVTNGMVGSTPFDQMLLQAYYRDGQFSIEQGLVQQDRHKVKLTGTVPVDPRSEEHTSELQSRFDLVCRLLLEKK